MNLPCRINHSIRVMSVISLNIPPDLQICLKLNSSWVDDAGTGCNVAYRRFQIVVCSINKHEVETNVGSSINWSIKCTNRSYLMPQTSHHFASPIGELGVEDSASSTFR
jgi:hypothetical protein